MCAGVWELLSLQYCVEFSALVFGAFAAFSLVLMLCDRSVLVWTYL